MRKFDKTKESLAVVIEEGKIHKLRLPKTDDTRKKLGDIGHSQYVEHDDHIGIYSKSPKAIRRVAEMLGGGARRAEQAAKKRTPLGKSIKPAMKKRLAAQEKKAAAKPGCGWFALCKNQSTTTRSHPILGDVPICKRCDDKVKAIEASSVEIPSHIKKRVTFRQEGGNDGAQYAVRVDGKLKINGLTKREAVHHQGVWHRRLMEEKAAETASSSDDELFLLYLYKSLKTQLGKEGIYDLDELEDMFDSAYLEDCSVDTLAYYHKWSKKVTVKEIEDEAYSKCEFAINNNCPSKWKASFKKVAKARAKK